MNKLLFLFIISLIGNALEAQTTIKHQSFETGDWGYTSNPGSGSIANTTSRFCDGNTSLQLTGSNSQGSDPNIVFDNVDISTFENVNFQIGFSASGPDSSDDLYLDVSYDDGASWNGSGSIKLVDGFGNASLAFGDTNASNPTTVASNPYSISIDNAETQIKIRIRFNEKNTSNNTSDHYFVDCISLTGTSTSTVPLVGFTATSSSIAEGSFGTNNQTIDIIMNVAPETDVTVQVTDAGTGSATVLSDYTFTASTLTFTTGESYPSTKNVTISIVGDAIQEPDETVDLSLTVTTGTATTGNTSYVLTITNDDAPAIFISEVDANTPGTDTEEFIELAGPAFTPLDNFVLVLYNGSNNLSYSAIDLNGISLDANGFFVLTFSSNGLQNGTDAVALYFNKSDSDFPSGTAPTQDGLVDALVYGSGANNTVLLSGLGQSEQIDEAVNGDAEGHSIQRGSWFVAPPTPGAANSMLPVTMTYFKANKVNGSVQLTWQTQAELNNAHFEIQRSNNSKSWSTIDQVVGAGTTDEIQNYEFMDKTPLNGMNYYRLKQVDYDGAFEIFSIVSVDMGKEQSISIYPNPVMNQAVFEFETDIQKDTTLSIYNVEGQLVRQINLEEDTSKLELSVHDLVKGIYIIHINTANTQLTQRFAKQ